MHTSITMKRMHGAIVSLLHHSNVLKHFCNIYYSSCSVPGRQVPVLSPLLLGSLSEFVELQGHSEGQLQQGDHAQEPAAAPDGLVIPRHTPKANRPGKERMVRNSMPKHTLVTWVIIIRPHSTKTFCNRKQMRLRDCLNL